MFAIQSSFAIFIDLNNFPLTGGYVYIGVANDNPETTPQTVYWDAAGTIPASQPLQTINGVIVRDGTPAQVFVASDYSITVRNRQGKLVYTLPVSNSDNFGTVSADYNTRTIAAASTIASGVTVIRLAGFDTPGDDGGTIYVSVPDTGDLPPYQFRSNGATRRWQLVAIQYVLPQNVGVIGGPDDKQPVGDADFSAQALGVSVLITKPSNIGSSYSFGSHVVFEASGKLIPAAGVLISFTKGFETASLDQFILDFSAASSGLGNDGSAVILTRELYPQMFGAVGDAATPNDAAFAKFTSAILASGIEGKIPQGNYKCLLPWVIDIGSEGDFGLTISGLGGKQKTILDFTSATLTDAAFIIQNTTGGSNHDIDYVHLADFSFIAEWDGPVARIGSDDFSDFVNLPRFDRMFFQNRNNTSNMSALRLNYCLQGTFDVQATCNADPNVGIPVNGVGLHLRQCQFCQFTGSVGTAGVGILMDTGSNAGNQFNGMDNENSGYCVRSNSGGNFNNTIIAGTWNWYTFGYDDVAGVGALIINPQPNPSGPSSTPPGTGTTAGMVTGAGTGVTVMHGNPGSYLPTTPAFPGWGVEMTNNTGQVITVEFWWAGGTSPTSFERNGISRTFTFASDYLSFKANPGDTFQFAGSGTDPTMLWTN